MRAPTTAYIRRKRLGMGTRHRITARSSRKGGLMAAAWPGGRALGGAFCATPIDRSPAVRGAVGGGGGPPGGRR
jgi:hypothetical protein